MWFAGVAISRSANAIAERTRLGHAFTGVLLLGTATSLPEIATTATAALGNHPVLAGTNLLGGVAMQVALLAFVDAFAVRGKALTYFSASPAMLMQGVMLIVMLAIGCAAIAVGEVFSLFGVGFWSLLLGGTYLVALSQMYRYERNPQWQLVEEKRTSPEPRSGNSRDDRSMRNILLRFVVASFGVLVGGYIVAETGAGIAAQTGIGESFIGATLLSVTTSLPELSTTITAVRLGAFNMAVGNILGTNVLEMALFLPADVLYRDGSILAALDPNAILLTALGIAVTCTYLWGVLEGKNRTVLGMGIDSALVILVYTGGMLLYYHVAV